VTTELQDGIPVPVADVTVVTAAFNAHAVIARAVESVARQTFRPLEHIVVDDGSTDGTAELLRKLESQHQTLRVISQINQGAGAARNAGIRLARGRYIAFLDADDFWDPGKLEAQLAFMQKSGASFTYGSYRVKRRGSNDPDRETNPPSVLTYNDLLRGCPIGCLTVMFDTSIHGKQEMPNVRRGQDWGLWLKLTRTGRNAYRYPGTLATYSSGGSSLSSNKVAKIADIYSIYRAQERIGALESAWLLALHAVGAEIRRRRGS
jgi:teichuronic acid biosynthesis glycosyltransferase TuaG